MATDWTLTATGPTNLSGQSGSPAVTDATVQVGSYLLAETGGPAGYLPSAWVCVGGIPGTGTVALAAGERATCTITNTALTPTLTLVKVVENGTTGATATAADWNLAAAGPTPLSGVSGTLPVTGAPVQVGDYARPAGRSAGYTASDWPASASIANGRSRSPRPGRTCTPEHRGRATLTLVMTVQHLGGTAQLADSLLSATGGDHPGSGGRSGHHERRRRSALRAGRGRGRC